MNRPTRFYLALHATLAAALAGAMALHLGPIPAHWPALAQRPVWTVWVLIGLWLALSAAGVALRPLPLWRVALGAAGAALLALALGGLALGTALAGGLVAGLGACALACAALAPLYSAGATSNNNSNYQQVNLTSFPALTPTSLASLDTDKPLYVKMWASWCQPCMEQMPHFHTLPIETPGSIVKYRRLSSSCDGWDRGSARCGRVKRPGGCGVT